MKVNVMKKLSILLLLFIIAGAFAVPQNYIRNGKFTYLKYRGSVKVADGVLPDPWQPQSALAKWPTDCTVVTDVKPESYNGNAYRITGTNYLFQYTYKVTPNKSYKLSCKMKTENIIAKAQPRFQIIWVDKNHREILRDYTDKNGKVTKGWDHKWTWTTSNHDWKEFTIPEITAPANAVYGKIRIGKADAAGVVYYADLKMEEISSEQK